MPPPIEVASVEAFQKAALQNLKTIAFFWAHWSEPCSALTEVFEDVSSSTQACCVRVEAEKLPEISGQLQVTAVPTFVFLQNGNAVDRIEGFDPEALYSKAAAFSGSGIAQNAQTAANGSQPPAAGDVTARLKQLVSREPVMLFMKGTPEAPFCGFSRRVVEALKAESVPFGHFDILSDEEVRQGLKAYSQWPTYPQLYANAELIGGCDIVLELAKEHELRAEIEAALAKGNLKLPEAGKAIDRRVKELLASHKVLLFMKGSPDAPRCGFSSKSVDALKAAGVEFQHFDILQDEEVRQGLKEYSNWPTYPQLYANGELIGGCDIILELAKAGELRKQIIDSLQKFET